MIPDKMSSASNAGNTAGGVSTAAENSVNMTSQDLANNTGHAQPTSTTVSAINSNTFVVKLKPSVETAARDNGENPKAPNLLQLFWEKGNRKNVSVVKTFGIGKIVVNRTLLHKGKKVGLPFAANTHLSSPPTQHSAARNNRIATSKQSAGTISVSVTPSGGTNAKFVKLVNGTAEKKPALPAQQRSLSVNNEKENRKEDDLGGNLVNLMNFRLSSLVPKAADPDVTETTPIKSVKPDLSPQNSPLKTQNRDVKPSAYDSDNDLTSLTWLTNKNLLKTMASCNPDDAGISLSGDESEEDDELDILQLKNKAVFTAKSKVDGNQASYGNRPYDQTYNPNGKPPYSFSCLIFMAVEDSPEKKLPVKEIYAWVCKHFPYFLTAPSGWKNSIRHNLSLNKCFKKADQGKNSQEPGKGALWCIDPAYRPNLIQALKRTPFYPYLYPGGVGQPLSLNNLASLLPGVRSGKIPLWSPTLSSSSNSAWADPDVASAAWNLMGLKGNDSLDKQPQNVKSTVEELAKEIFGQRRLNRRRTFSSNSQESVGTIPLIITHPSEDHTYSCVSVSDVDMQSDVPTDARCVSPDSDKSAPDAAYEFETCGTDMDSDEDLLDSGGDHVTGESDGDLADSGFAGLRGRKKTRQSGRGSSTRKRKSEEQSNPPAKRSRRSSSKSPRQSKKSLKVRFQGKNKKKEESPKSGRKKKCPPKKADVDLGSDGDSGKDSPKIVQKSRRRVRTVDTQNRYTKPYKTKRSSSPQRAAATSPYGTRSTTQPRHSKRIAIKKQSAAKDDKTRRAPPWKRRRESGCHETEDEEEIKLAAGSLMHLAGVRSPSAAN